MTAARFDNLTSAEIYANPPLRAYLSKVQRRHGYVHLLGLPDRSDRPNVPIEFMLVPPLVSPRPISVDSNPKEWMPQCESLVAALERYGRVLLLGDPGTGKTTFFNYLAWILTFAGGDTPSLARFGWVLPVPMMLRELPLESVTTFDGLLSAFLSQRVGEPLREEGDYIRGMLKEGRALVMLDGIDEIGSKEARLDLREAVFDGMRRFPDCLWLLSSRVVGYGEVPFERRQVPGKNGGDATDSEIPKIGTRYVAPFNDGRIKRFVQNWYAMRDQDALKEGKADELAQAIGKDKALQRLARVPNILALMALVHRNEAILPHERWLLYEHIADAYLESIDKHRGIGTSTHDLPRKKMWLARVGYEMQKRREHAGDTDLLVPCDDALHWIGSEMERSKAFVDVPTPAEFLSFVGRRSGLFVPKADEQYAFSHLSFQEYFAAVALEGEVTGFKWAKQGRSSLGFDRTSLAAWARQPSWLETFCFLFEMLANRPEWHSELMNCVFGDGFSLLGELEAGEELFNLGYLAARLVVNPYSGLGEDDRAVAIDWCVRTQIRCSDYHLGNSDYYFGNNEHVEVPDRSLFELLIAGDQGLSDEVLSSIRRHWAVAVKDLDYRILDLRRVNIANLEPISGLSSLEVLILTDANIGDISCIKRLPNLSWLDLEGAAVEDISPIGNMRKLSFLNLERTKIDDISPLHGLDALTMVLLSYTSVSEQAIKDLEESLPRCYIVKDE